ncbi:ABC transporter substrate-binding protein [Bradyrhizobium sp. DOA9]|uniref:ABC transporter substrate-binding protein n=1 Tax=Bradyrhizobium sp. DOA9 TaxID=1126627 RepID=UPI001FCD6CCF|nr:ABC transporter substrate-binding protein [Bradyrhizobium sp. DOA9]
MVKPVPLSNFDPVFSSLDTTHDHAFAIYDQLFAIDSELRPQPQMVGKWEVSEDRMTYTFELREGLGWHDSTAVTAADCIASIRRWSQVATGGKLLMSRIKDISRKDEKTFSITLNERAPVIDLLASPAGNPLFMMREKDANRPATEQVTANIGSGPFKFNEALARPGSSFAYDRNKNYVPRKEPADVFAGGKVVKIERIVWETVPDPQTAIAALQTGEIDFVQRPPIDLLSVLEGDPNIEVETLNTAGVDWYLRLNHLQGPFSNVKARQALLHLIDQEAFMRAAVGDSRYISTITSIFGKGSPYSNGENTGWYRKGGNRERAKQLFKEAGYGGEKVVILQPTDFRDYSSVAQLLAQTLQQIGVNAELAPSDYAGVVRRRANKGPVTDGGWSIFIVGAADFNLGEPLSGIHLAATGDRAWFGWPYNEEYEAVRTRWAEVETVQERQELARKMQSIWWDFVGFVFLGRQVQPVAYRKSLKGLVQTPVTYVPMWNMRKS